AMAVPGAITSAMSAGCHESIRGGARLVTSYHEVLEEGGRIGEDPAPPGPAPEGDRGPLGPGPVPGVGPRPPPGGRGPRQGGAGLPLRQVLRALAMLEQTGHVLLGSDGGYSLPRKAKPTGPVPATVDG